jgi:hypothetical protein
MEKTKMLRLNAWELAVLEQALAAYIKENGSTFGTNRNHLNELLGKIEAARGR